MTIKIDTKGLDDLLDKVESLSPRIDQAVYTAMADEGLSWRDDVRDNTPVDTGDLRRSWELTGPDKKGLKFEMDLANNLEYAEHVEYGHRQEPGRFVPAIGKRLKADFVPGSYMLRDGTRRLEDSLKPAVQKEVRKAIESL
ncbi:HK97 gp10 family phage protein [Anaerococcus murdochii]|uniref:HK97 gp10 family phage protein n=1 Tax=Anaerococcus murdochii TaxID=411577 RepID=A0ABS7T1V5_9FIRM|nr:HK97 gp10 family phage protein [Anaerococcus murdochii]MBZ2387783.1 HK97 gp10 family phage protein [Anaerococcus murdochii]